MFPQRHTSLYLHTSLGHMWTWQFSRLLHHVMVNAFGAKSPTYGTIVELDRKVRDFPVPPYLQPRCEGDEELTDAAIILHVQRLLLLTNKETSKHHMCSTVNGTYSQFSVIEYSSTVLHPSVAGPAE